MENLLAVVDQIEMNELHYAVLENRLEAVKYLVQNKVVLTNTMSKGQTSLHVAASLNYHDIMKVLFKYIQREEIQQFMNIKTTDTGNSALHVAAKNNSIESVRILLGNGANFEIEDEKGRRAVDLTTDFHVKLLLMSVREIFELVKIGDSGAITTKLKSYPPENLIAIMHARNSQNHTALQVALENGSLEAIGSIVNFRINSLVHYWQEGLKLEKLMKHSKSAREHLSKLEVLHHQINKSSAKEESDIVKDYKNQIFYLLLTVDLLLDSYKNQGNVNLTHREYLIIIDESLEYYGCYGGPINKRCQLTEGDRSYCIKLLKISIIAPMMLFMRSVYSSELLAAARHNNLEVVKQCLTGQPDLEETDSNDYTPLHYALCHGNLQMTKLLMDFGADPTRSSDNKKVTPLHAALSLMEGIDVIDVIEYHLHRISEDKLADYINAKDSNGSTALHTTVKSEYLEIAILLLSKGATYCVEEQDGKTPEDLAHSFEMRELFFTIGYLFECALKGETEIIEIYVETITVEDLMAVSGARDAQGFTLIQVLLREGLVETANKIEEMLANEK